MVVVKIYDSIEKKDYEFYMDGKLKKQLDTIVIPSLQKKDKDWVLSVDGIEGSGKSVFALQLGKYVDPSLSLERVCFTAKKFREAIIKAKPHQCVIFDEAFTGLSSRAALSEVNHMIVSLMMQMRQKNLFIIIVLPTFFLLDKYVALWRASGLFHVYEKHGKRGRWIYFSREKKKRIYLLGKKTYSYIGAKSYFRGRFLNKYMVDETKYRKLKKEALEATEKEVKKDKYIFQRDVLILMLRRICKKPQKEIAKWFFQWNVNLGRSAISEIERKYTEKHGNVTKTKDKI